MTDKKNNDKAILTNKIIPKQSLLDKKERVIFAALVGGFALFGAVGGLPSVVLFTSIGLIIWVFWRGRQL